MAIESGLVSWQFGSSNNGVIFPSAELNLNLSSPISPSNPPSPSLYNGGNGSAKAAQGPSTTGLSRAQLASEILNDLEKQASNIGNDFGINWNEETVNLNLFEELEEIEYTPPASPKKSSSAVALAEPKLDSSASESAADISAITAELQAILDTLPKESGNVDNTAALTQVLQLAGIPTTIVDGEALVPIEVDLDLDSISNLHSMEIDMASESSQPIIGDGNAMVVDESELYTMSDLSNQGSPAGSVASSGGYFVEEPDEHSDAAQKILDALMVGDVTTAETYLPTIQNYDESSMASSVSVTSDEDYEPETTQTYKPERRGRKPGKRLSKSSPTYLKDKALRKKEQNKTAATRYRQKKKMEFGIILETESELQETHDELEKQKENLQKEILMVKQLLRDVMKARKPRTASKPVVMTGGALTASTLVIRNRRK